MVGRDDQPTGRTGGGVCERERGGRRVIESVVVCGNACVMSGLRLQVLGYPRGCRTCGGVLGIVIRDLESRELI